MQARRMNLISRASRTHSDFTAAFLEVRLFLVAPARANPLGKTAAATNATGVMGNFFSSEEVHPVIIKKPDGELVEVWCDLSKHGADLLRAVAAKMSRPAGSFALVHAGKQIREQEGGETLFENGFIYTGTTVHFVDLPR